MGGRDVVPMENRPEEIAEHAGEAPRRLLRCACARAFR
jgi:hypothetical protein